MIKTQPVHHTEQFVYELIGCGFEFRCSHLDLLKFISKWNGAGHAAFFRQKQN